MHAYLDNNATTQPLPEVVDAMAACLREAWGNPSSVHRAGIEARHHLELARESVGALVGCAPREIIFTSGGTEAANLALATASRAACAAAEQPWEGRSLIVTARTEHSAVREKAQALARADAQVEWLRVDDAGVVECAHLEAILRARAALVAVVSVMWANNETGAVQPVERVAALCREHGVRFHCDATQWIGRMPADLGALGADFVSFSAHKFHGPKGIGALVVRSGAHAPPQIVGGPQERDRRGGTENVAGAVGMGVAARAAAEWIARGGPAGVADLRDRFERAVLTAVPDATVHAARAPRLPNTTNIAFPHLEAEALLLLLSERGVAASAGAACSSGSLEPSPVLLAMGVPEPLAHGSVRFSLSRFTTAEEVAWAAATVAECVERLRKSWRA
jgi:cysteine desulfurase